MSLLPILILMSLGQASPGPIVKLDTKLSIDSTGFLIGKTDDGWGILATANHVLDYEPIDVISQFGKSTRIQRIIARDSTNDIGLAMIPWTGQVMKLADELPTIGSPINMIGATSGKLSSSVLSVGSGIRGIRFLARTRNGDSGGPIYLTPEQSLSPRLEDYEVIGLLTNGDQVSTGPHCRAIRGLLNKVGWSCRNGRCVRINQPQSPPPSVSISGSISQTPSRLILPWRKQEPIDYDRIRAEGKGNVDVAVSPLAAILSKLVDRSIAGSKVARETGEKLSGIGSRIEGIAGKVSSLGSNAPIVTNQEDDRRRIFGIPLESIVLAGASALGVGIPTWAIVAYRGARVVKRIRRRNRRSDDEESESLPSPMERTEDPPRAVVVDAPPSRRKNLIDTQYINVESDHFRRASELANQDVVRRYPGAQEIIATQKSLTQQHLAGMVSAKSNS